MLEITKTNKLIAVLAIAAAFFATEIAVGFLTRSLALVADAFHIMSDIIGYIVAIIAVKLAGTATPSIRFTYGYQRAEVIGAFFNGAFLMALGVSVILQSIERFIEPAEVTDPVLVMAIGAAGIGSNALMLLVLGGHGHDHSSPAETAQPTDGHSGHAHVRRAAPIKGRDLNILGVLIHILGDALNSIAVIISAGIYKATGFIYADPIASLFVGIMILGTAWPLLRRSGESLFDAVPGSIDVQGVQEDIERISGSKSVHDLHVWSLDDKNVLATFHLGLDEANYNRQEAMMEDIRACLRLWGIHSATIQSEMRVRTESNDAR